MNYSDYRFTLDIQIHQAQVSIPVTFGDSARRLCIGLTDGRKPYTIGEGCIAVFNAKKPDGTSLKNSCIIERNAIIYEFTEQTTNCEGVVKCDLTLYGADGKILTSPQFIIVVDKRVVRDEDVPVSQSEATAISGMLTAEAQRQANEIFRLQNEDERIAEEQRRDAEEAKRQANEAQRIDDYVIADQKEAERYTAETARADAEGVRAEAEANRATEERSRCEAEFARETAEAIRKRNEINRSNEEDYRNRRETERAEAEFARIDAEAERVAEEDRRYDAELERQSAESQRSEAEAERAEAEARRAEQIGKIETDMKAYVDEQIHNIKDLDVDYIVTDEIAVGGNDDVIISEYGISARAGTKIRIGVEEVATKKDLQDAIDNIEMALDELHAYAEALKGGEA